MASANKEKLINAETIMPRLGHNLLKPSESPSPITIPISKSPASTNRIQAISRLPSKPFLFRTFVIL